MGSWQQLNESIGSMAVCWMKIEIEFRNLLEQRRAVWLVGVFYARTKNTRGGSTSRNDSGALRHAFNYNLRRSIQAEAHLSEWLSMDNLSYLADRGEAAASGLTSRSAISVSLRSASLSSSSVACSLSAASLSPSRKASARAVPYPAIS